MCMSCAESVRCVPDRVGCARIVLVVLLIVLDMYALC